MTVCHNYDDQAGVAVRRCVVDGIRSRVYLVLSLVVCCLNGVTFAQQGSGSELYLGCYDDNNDTIRTFIQEIRGKVANMTPDVCRNGCREYGYTYIGLWAGNGCWCTEVNPSNTAELKRVSESLCVERCFGDRSKMCGGSKGTKIYSTYSSCPKGKFGRDCDRNCNCKDNRHCLISGRCPGGKCAPGWRLQSSDTQTKQQSCSLEIVDQGPPSPIRCQPISFSITVDDEMELFVDGIKVTSLRNAAIYNQADTIHISCNTKVIAVRGKNIPRGEEAGILASSGRDLIITDSSWKCTNVSYPRWSEVDYDDSSWPSAKVFDFNGKPHDRTRFAYVAGISEMARWIWLRQWNGLLNSTYEEMDGEVFCRKTLSSSDCSGACRHLKTLLPTLSVLLGISFIITLILVLVLCILFSRRSKQTITDANARSDARASFSGGFTRSERFQSDAEEDYSALSDRSELPATTYEPLRHL